VSIPARKIYLILKCVTFIKVPCMGETRNAYEILVGKPEGTRPLGGRMILEWILGKQIGRAFIGFISLRIGTSGWLV
jgi:hypothetical protein